MSVIRILGFLMALIFVMAGVVPALATAQSNPLAPKSPVASSSTKNDIVKQTETDIRAIPAKADSDEQFVNDVIQHAQGLGDGSALKQKLEGMLVGISNLENGFRDADFKKLPIQRLETLVEHWNFYDKQLIAWRKNLQEKTLPISSDAADLASRKKYWMNLRVSAKDVMSPALLQRVDDLIAEIDRAENAISVPLSRLIDLGQQGNTVAQRVEVGIGKTTQLVKDNDVSLLKLDSPNLWQAASEPASKVDPQFLQNFKIESQYSSEYAQAYSTRISLLRALYLILLGILLWLSWKSKSVISNRPELAEYKNTLRRPFSSWLVLMALGIIALQDDLPLMVQQFVLLIIWIPMLRLLPRKVFKMIGPWVYMSAVFYALGILGYTLSANQFLFRLILLFTNLLMIFTMFWLIRRSSAFIQSYTGIWLKIIKTAVFFGFSAIVLAVVCNLIGNVTMSEMLTQATIDSSYLALFLYTSISVLTGFFLFAFKNQSERLLANAQHASSIIGLLVNLYKIAIFVFWLIATLKMFRVWLPFSEFGRQIMAYSIEIGKFSITMGSILLFPITVYVAYWVAKTIRLVLNEDVFPNMNLPRGVGNSVSSILYYALIMFGFLIALAVAGFQVSQLGMIISALSVGIGFGLNTVVNNFVSGLILMLERPIQPGDTIEVSGTLGKVRDIGMRATTLSTFDGADVVVPNGMLLSEKMVNWTLSSDNRRIDISIGVAYGSDPEKVLELLLEIACSIKGVSPKPPPSALFTGFGDSALNFNIRAWTTSYDDSVFIRSEMAIRIYKALNDAGIEIPFPQRDLHIRSVPTETLKPLTGV